MSEPAAPLPVTPAGDPQPTGAGVPLRLLLVVATYYPDSYGGAERQAKILATALRKLNVETRIVAPTVTAGLPQVEPTEFGAVERIRLREFPNYGGRHIGSTLAWTRRFMARFAGPEEVDAVYVFHARLHVLPALLAARRLRVPLLIKLGGGGEASDFEALRQKRFLYGRWLLNALLKRTDGFVANSGQIEDDLRALGVPAERVFAFPNGVEVPAEGALADAEGGRDGRRFVFAGRMVSDKSVDVLFEAARTLLAEGRDLTLTFLGDGPEQERLQALASELGLSDRILTPGVAHDVYPVLFASDFFVSASEREGQSNALIEAMSAGCVPIVFGASGASDLIESGDTGFLVERSAPDAFADAMRRALDMEPKARAAMARRVRDQTRERIGIDSVAARTVRALRTVIERRRGVSVSVLITCFNEGAYIGDAVKSVLAQTRAEAVDRIVIMDDGSEPSTREVLRDIETWDPRIDVAYGPGGYGLPKNRNLAAARCASPFLALLDGDDLWAPDKLARQLDLMQARPDLGLTYTGYSTFADLDLSTARASEVADLDGAADLTRAYFLNDPPIMPSSVVMRRDAFEAAGRFDDSIRVFEDTDFYLRLSRHAGFAAVQAPLIYKRNRTSSITGRRRDLMSHHAYVAFRFAATETRLLPLVPRRLAERARKLGNLDYYEGRVTDARRFWALAAKLDPLSARAVGSWLLAALGGERAQRLLDRRLASRAATLGR